MKILIEQKILKEQSLPELIKTNIRVISEAKQLDSDMQKLVYEKYSRFMSASKTVRTLQVLLFVYY